MNATALTLLDELYIAIAEREVLRRMKSELSFRYTPPTNTFFITVIAKIRAKDNEIVALVEEMKERGK